MRLKAVIVISCFSVATWAQSAYDKAVIENAKIQAPTGKSSKASEAQVGSSNSAMLSLRDDFETKSPRAWKWRFGVTAQSFQPEGPVTNPTGQTQNLSESGSSWMPLVSFGASTNPGDGVFAAGQLRGGYLSQSLSMTTASRQLDTVLSTTLVAIRPQVGWQRGLTTLSALGEVGQLTYSQTSSSAKASMTRRFEYTGVGAELAYRVSKNAQVNVAYVMRDARGSDENQIQKNNLDMGASFLW